MFRSILGNRLFLQPEGGVTRGQIFHSATIPTGAWKDGIWDCCNVGLCHVQCCLAYLCAPLALGQVLSRLHLNIWGSPLRSYSDGRGGGGGTKVSTFVIMLLITICYMILNATLQIMLDESYYTENLDDDETERMPSSPFTTSPRDERLQILRSSLELAFGLFILVLLIRTRQYMRARYNIATGCCGQAEDCCCAFFCGPCLVCQMARHTADYRHDCCCAPCCRKCCCEPCCPSCTCQVTMDDGRAHRPTCCTSTGIVMASSLVV